MKNKIKIIAYIVLAVIVIAGALGLLMRMKRERDLSLNNIIALQDTIKKKSIELDGLRITLYEKNALVLDLKDAVKAGLIEKEYWRKLHMTAMVANIQLKGELKAAKDSLAVLPDVKFITVKDTSGLSSDYVKVPFTLLSINDSHLKLSAGMSENKSAWYNLSIPITGTVNVGYKGSTAVGVFSSDNPFLNVTNMQVIISPYNTKWHEKWYMSGGIGFLLGIGVNSLIKK